MAILDTDGRLDPRGSQVVAVAWPAEKLEPVASYRVTAAELNSWKCGFDCVEFEGLSEKPVTRYLVPDRSRPGSEARRRAACGVSAVAPPEAFQCFAQTSVCGTYSHRRSALRGCQAV
jgi:hypothetical protein